MKSTTTGYTMMQALIMPTHWLHEDQTSNAFRSNWEEWINISFTIKQPLWAMAGWFSPFQQLLEQVPKRASLLKFLQAALLA
jgi:hypothetical protein